MESGKQTRETEQPITAYVGDAANGKGGFYNSRSGMGGGANGRMNLELRGEALAGHVGFFISSAYRVRRNTFSD